MARTANPNLLVAAVDTILGAKPQSLDRFLAKLESFEGSDVQGEIESEIMRATFDSSETGMVTYDKMESNVLDLVDGSRPLAVAWTLCGFMGLNSIERIKAKGAEIATQRRMAREAAEAEKARLATVSGSASPDAPHVAVVE